MKLQYGIAGFLIGIGVGLMLGLIEMKWMMGRQFDTLMPFIIGLTVIASMMSGVIIGRKIGRSRE
ncbi:MAG: hypothetical protein ABIN94_16405 [Ferruginibacter sp.]